MIYTGKMYAPDLQMFNCLLARVLVMIWTVHMHAHIETQARMPEKLFEEVD